MAQKRPSTRKAYQAEWVRNKYQTDPEYAARKREAHNAYYRTAAGMLANMRSAAKQRKGVQ